MSATVNQGVPWVAWKLYLGVFVMSGESTELHACFIANKVHALSSCTKFRAMYGIF